MFIPRLGASNFLHITFLKIPFQIYLIFWASVGWNYKDIFMASLVFFLDCVFVFMSVPCYYYYYYPVLCHEIEYCHISKLFLFFLLSCVCVCVCYVDTRTHVCRYMYLYAWDYSPEENIMFSALSSSICSIAPWNRVSHWNWSQSSSQQVPVIFLLGSLEHWGYRHAHGCARVVFRVIWLKLMFESAANLVHSSLHFFYLVPSLKTQPCSF